MNQESKTVENAPEMGIDRLSLPDGLELLETEEGLTLAGDGMTLRADFTDMIPRIRQGRLHQELLVRAAKIKGVDEPLAVDATAGFGQDSLLLAASGFRVLLFERNPVIAALLRDALRRATSVPELANAIARMRFIEGDSVVALNNMDAIDADAHVGGALRQPDVVYLDPMFPARTKSAAVKKKFQLLHRLEQPCEDPDAMLHAALAAKPRKIVVKRPPKGPYLANVKPSYSLAGKAVRYDVIVPPRG
jgi:16S rRNA (guanine1516-N2)-methyltransferase